MASLFNRGPGKVSNKQRGAEASGSLWKMYSATRGKLMGVTESPLDDEVKEAMDQLKTTKAEFNSIIGGARGMIQANKTAQQSSEYLIEALRNSGASGQTGPWSEASRELGTVITSCQAYNVSMWERIESLVDKLAAFFDEDIVAAKTLKDQYKQAKFDYDSAETAFNKATNEKRAEKERLRNEKKQKAEQMRVHLIECVRQLEEKKHRDMTYIVHEYLECLKEYHEQANHTCSQAGAGGGAAPSAMSAEKRGSYVFGSASADADIAESAPVHRYSQPDGGQTSSSSHPPPPASGAAFGDGDQGYGNELVDAGTALQSYPSVEDDDVWGNGRNNSDMSGQTGNGSVNPFDALDDDFIGGGQPPPPPQGGQARPPPPAKNPFDTIE